MDDCKRELKIFARTMRLRRYEMNLTQQDLAERMDYNVNAIGNIERAQAFPSFKTIIKLAIALEISAKELMP